jgi:hypothetical protein
MRESEIQRKGAASMRSVLGQPQDKRRKQDAERAEGHAEPIHLRTGYPAVLSAPANPNFCVAK